jgi:DNA-directed RNA polymerase subunit RPC12/RpoP
MRVPERFQGRRTVNRMVCEDCGTVYYSAAARIMVEQGQRCAKCGGRLVLGDGPRPVGERRGRPRPRVPEPPDVA